MNCRVTQKEFHSFVSTRAIVPILINALFGNQWIQFLMNNGNFSTREHQCTQNDSARLKILDVKCSKSHYSSSNGVFHGIWTRLKISFFNIMMMLYGTFGNLLAHVTFSAFSSNWIRLTGWKMAKQWDSIWCYFSITPQCSYWWSNGKVV